MTQQQAPETKSLYIYNVRERREKHIIIIMNISEINADSKVQLTTG